MFSKSAKWIVTVGLPSVLLFGSPLLPLAIHFETKAAEKSDLIDINTVPKVVAKHK